MPRSTLITLALLLPMLTCPLAAAPAPEVKAALQAIAQPPVGEWRFRVGEVAGAEQPAFDDSKWEIGTPEFEWGSQPVAWLRTTITVPETVGGFPISGSRLVLRVAVDDDGVIFVNGKEAGPFHWDQGRVVLTQHATPGQRFVVAVKGLNTGGPGRLLASWLEVEALAGLKGPIETYLQDVTLAEMAPGGAAIAADSLSKVDLAAARRGDGEALLASLGEARTALAPAAALLRGYTTHLVGHAHIDMNWLWLWPETVDVCRNTFSTVLKLMGEYPQFRFSQSQAPAYLAVEQADPALFERIRQAVRAGRWEVTGGTWVEGDMNMASGEAIVRQILYAKRYFRARFGVESRVCWEPDTFGHAWTIPQILAGSDLDYYYFCRAGKDEPVFWWQAPDGSRVLAFSYAWYSRDIEPGIGPETIEIAGARGLRDHMVVYGVGDHGGGPTRLMINAGLDLQRRPVYPKLQFSTAHAYFDAVRGSKAKLPVVNDELNFAFRGCYTTHGDIKRWNRESESLLPAAEAFSVVAATFGRPYPAADLRLAWQNTCFNQFHDLFDGSAIHGSYEYSKGLYDQAMALGNQALDGALAELAGRIDTRGEGLPVVVWNPLAWARTDTVTMPLPAGLPAGRLSVTAGGQAWPAQAAEGRLTFTAHDVPGLGYRLFRLRPAAAQAGVRAEPAPVGRGLRSPPLLLENEYLRVRLDPASGTVVSLYDKRQRREMVPPGQRAGLLQVLYERPHGMSAWEIGPISRTESLDRAISCTLVERGPSRAVVRTEHAVGSSRLVQEFTLNEGVPRLDIHLTADWQERGGPDHDAPMLKVAFPAALAKPRATFEIPFGAIERPAEGDEVPAQKWADLSGGGSGLSLLNDCKYGHDVSGSTMRLTLLRSSYEPDPTPDLGVHHVTYSLYPHAGTWQQAATPRRGYELNNPLRAMAVTPHAGSLPPAQSFLSVTPDTVIVTALKQAEAGGGLIVRCYNTTGQPVTARLRTALPVKLLADVNHIERPLGRPRPAGRQIDLPLGKHQIRTVRLTLGE